MTIEPVPGFDPDHNFYDRAGNPVSLLEWGRLCDADRTVREDARGTMRIRTVYLGFVDPMIYDARLFGTARIEKDVPALQLQVYNSEPEALTGHVAHVEAVDAGFHCHLCRVGEDHT